MTYSSIVYIISQLVKYMTWVMLSLALVIFLYGLTKYMLGAGDDSSRKESLQYIMYGVIGLFVMMAMWGLVSVLVSTFIPGSGSGIPQIEI